VHKKTKLCCAAEHHFFFSLAEEKKSGKKMRRGGGGLYGNFVSANDGVNNKAYRGAEIPPPPSLLQPASRPVMPKVGGKMVGVTSAALGTQAYFFRNFCHWGRRWNKVI